MAIWIMTQSLGNITWILFDNKTDWIKEIVIAGVFILFAIYDYFYFRMYPAQENIFVEDSQSLRKQKQHFDKINARIKLKDSVS